MRYLSFQKLFLPRARAKARSRMRSAVPRRAALLLSTAAVLTVSGGCAKKPGYVVMPWKQFQLEPAAALPLNGDDRSRLERYFAKDGNTLATADVPNPGASAQKTLLDALSDPANLSVDLSEPRKKFCDDAQALCRKTQMFHNANVVRQVVDASQERPKLSGQPLAVSDGHFVYIFDWSTAGNEKRLTSLKVVRALDREITR